MPNESSLAENVVAHIPGPWVVVLIDEKSKRDLHIDSPVAFWIAQPEVSGEVVAIVEDARLDRGEANANLIAAAPDLASALTPEDIDQITEGIEEFIIEGYKDIARVWQPYIDKLNALKAAVEKATGVGR